MYPPQGLAPAPVIPPTGVFDRLILDRANQDVEIYRHESNTLGILNKLNVSGNLKALSLTAEINVETLTADKTLVPGVDKMYQYLKLDEASVIITLDTTTAKPGDRFIIKNNSEPSNPGYLEIRQGGVILDGIFSRSIKEYIFNGTNWVSADAGTGTDNDYNIALGYRAVGFDSGIAIGYDAAGFHSGIAIGYGAWGFNNGTAVGYGAKSMRYGVAVGYKAGFNLFDELTVRNNVLMGAYSGFRLTTGSGNIIIGYRSGYDPVHSPVTGSRNILIGFEAGTPVHGTSNFLNIGNLIFATGVNTATGAGISTGNVGIGTLSHWAKLAIRATEPGPAGWLKAIHFDRPEHSAITLTHPTAGGLLFGMHGELNTFYFGRYHPDGAWDRYLLYIVGAGVGGIWAGANTLPFTDNTYDLGLDTYRWRRIRGVAVVSGDFVWENNMRATEDGDGIAFYNQKGEKIAILTAEGDLWIRGQLRKL